MFTDGELIVPPDPVHAPAPALAAALNLGPRSAAALAGARITSIAQLRRAGAVATYVRLKRSARGMSLNMLYALVGALEGLDWKQIKRERKLELLMQVEDYERLHPGRVDKKHDELLALRNIGLAMRRDFDLLGIRTAAQLARCNADTLFARIQRKTHTRHDPCVWDTYAAAIHQARTSEALPWWHFTRERKRREAEGSFMRCPTRPSSRK